MTTYNTDYLLLRTYCFVLAEFHLDTSQCKLPDCSDHDVGRDDEFSICVAAIVLSIVFSVGLIWYNR